MKTRILLCALIMLLAGLMLPSRAVAAEFSPALDYELSSKGPADFASAIIILESPIDIRALDERLHLQQATRADRYRQVVEALHYNADMTQPAFRAELDEAKLAGRVRGYTAYWIENLFVVSATREFIETMRPRGDVKYVTENFKPELIEPVPGTTKGSSFERNPLDTRLVPPGIVAVGALRVAEELGITGMGVLVGNCDTGVDGNHPALASRWRGNFAPWYHCWMDNLGTNTQFPNDGYGHGTHVMGTITGRAISGTDTTWIGCAPNARWIANNAINQGVSPDFDNDIILSYQWFTNPDSNINTLDDVPDVIQNSWGVFTGLGYPQCFDFWNTVVLNCEAAGVVVTWSAGNESTSGLRSPAIYQINNYQIFSVGAVDATNYSWPYPLASFSSQGPTPCQPNPGAIKPEVVAPGVDVYSSVPGGGYSGSYSGTSMAGPHVAGVVALMREACPNCDPQTIKAAIMNTARDEGPAGEDNQFGAGFIDAYAAVIAVSNLGHLVGTVTDAFNAPLSGALVKNANGLQQTLTNANGQYDLPLNEGTYTIEYSKFGYVTQSIGGIVIVEGSNTTQDVSLQLAPQGTVSGIVTNCFGNPAYPATVTVLNTPVPPANTDPSGFYSITLPQGTYDMRASGAGCGAHTVNGVVVGVSTTQDFTLPVDPRYECSAPDAAGYIACEDGDLNGPTYAWFEVSPNAGGPGTNTGVYGDDTGTNVAIPFTFRLYGQNYTSVWMCTNGFLSFSTTSSTFSNQALPYSGIGYAVCPFWDDLYVVSGTGDMSYYYLAAENAFILEWHTVGHFGNQSQLETFQVWLYNVATNPSPTGDSQIKFQYQDVTGISSNTIGVQSGTIANQYVFNNTLDPNAQGIVDGRVICYGGCNPPIVGTMQGTITDCFGAPAANATVSFPGSFYPPIQTNGAGFYTINMVPGTYNVRADKLPCTYIRSDGHVVEVDQTTTVDLTLRAPTRIVGTVTDCAGGPAVGAIVSFPGSTVADTVTDASGNYQKLVDAGTYNVNARNNTCSNVQSNNNVVAEAQTVTVNLTLAAPGVLQGTVTSCTGGPAVGATVTLSGGPVTPPPAQTNGAGFYQFTTLPAGDYAVLVTFGGCAPGNANVVITSGQTTTQDFMLVSDPRALCSAPDAYGYYACENLDGGGPVYAWQGIHPSEGGSGTIINQSCDDCYTSITLPFPVQFYGVSYPSTAYVGSNGYLTFSAGATSFSNICLPATYMPAGVYPFWDDLYTACPSADVVTYYDVTNHWFVVEWYRTCHCCSEGNYENFQIIIYDVAFYPTATGDNDIVVQYNSLSLITSNTVGIQSVNGATYLLYQCNNVMQPHAFGMAQGRAIKFTTGPGCVGDPDISVNPTSVVGQAPLGGTDTEVVQICNNGVCPLRYTVDFNQITPAAAMSTGVEPSTVTMTKEEISWLEAINRGEKPAPFNAERGHHSVDDQGGPDAYGYRWIDSNEPGGPVFDWVEISGIGNNTGLTDDDQTMSFPLPFTFNFYGIDYTTVNISSNGNMHFGPANAAYWNDNCDLPNPSSGPLAMIAPFWDDMYLPYGGTVYYYNDAPNSRYIVEWYNIRHISGDPLDVYTYQVIIYQNGRIVLQYLTLGTGGTYGVESCFVGIQNETGTIALEVVCDLPYLEDNLAIQIQAATQWMSLQGALTGSLEAGQCTNITLNFDAADLPQGTYTGELIIDSNDPDEDPVIVPVTFNVGELEAPTNLTVYYLPATNQLEFRWVASAGAVSYTILSSTSPDGPFNNVVATTPNTVHQIPFDNTAKMFYVVIANGQ